MGQVDTSSDVHFLIFVDIDGVLNIGVREPGQPPLLFSDVNVNQALQFKGAATQRDFLTSVELLLCVHKREVGRGEKSTYADYMASGGTALCERYVQRLARIIQEARAKGELTVVLSSSWRRPQYTKHVRVLEEELSRVLGRPFVFDARTPLGDDKSKDGRIGAICDYLIGFRSRGGAHAKKLRVLALEDFNITAVDSTVAVEQYFSQRAALPGNDVDVCLVHTFDTWKDCNGDRVQIGCGLTEHHFNHALKFIKNENYNDNLPVSDVAGKVLVVDGMAVQDIPKRGPKSLNAVGWLKVMAGFVCAQA